MKSTGKYANIFVIAGTIIFILGFGGCTINFVGQIGNGDVGNTLLVVSFIGLALVVVGIIFRRMSNSKVEEKK